MKRNLIGIIIGSTIAISGVVITNAQIQADIPLNLQLKVPKGEIIESRVYSDGEKNIVTYSFLGASVIDEPNEIISQRAENKKVFIGDKQGEYKMRVYSNGSFTKDKQTDQWVHIDTATTTEDSFNIQTAGLFGGLIKNAFADISNVYETKDTFYGTSFLPGPNHTNTLLWYGGWGDHYYDYIEWDLTGTPTSAETTDAIVYFKASGIATNWANMQIRRVTSSWAEATLTRTNLPTDAGTTDQIDQTQPLSSETYYGTSILLFYENWKDGTWTNYGIVLKDLFNTNSQGTYYSSNQAGTSDDPYLEITYTTSTTISPRASINGNIQINGTIKIQ